MSKNMTNFVANFVARMSMSHAHNMYNTLRLAVVCLFACVGVSMASAQTMAGTTASTATVITDTVVLGVQSGWNHLRIEPNHLPATIVYTPDTAFGPIPALIEGDTLPAEMFFDDCVMAWRWTIEASTETAWIIVAAHEHASIKVSPTMSTLENRIEETACDKYELDGKTYTASGEYNLGTTINESGEVVTNILVLTIHPTTFSEETISDICLSYEAPSGKIYTEAGVYEDSTLQDNGCYHITTLTLEFKDNCFRYDTVYFCRGFNTQHEEQISESLIRRFEPYFYESPDEWDWMEGVILEREHDSTLVDLNRAERNLTRYYVGDLTPIESIVWTIRYAESSTYEPVVIEEGEQWLKEGQLAVQIRFLCGEVYNNEYPMAIDETRTALMPVKRIENGQVVIIRGGERYSIVGTKIE